MRLDQPGVCSNAAHALCNRRRGSPGLGGRPTWRAEQGWAGWWCRWSPASEVTAVRIPVRVLQDYRCEGEETEVPGRVGKPMGLPEDVQSRPHATGTWSPLAAAGPLLERACARRDRRRRYPRDRLPCSFGRYFERLAPPPPPAGGRACTALSAVTGRRARRLPLGVCCRSRQGLWGM